MESVVQALAGVLASLAIVSAVGIVVVRIVAPRSGLGRVAAGLVQHATEWTTAIAVTATLGSLYFSEIANYAVCRMCWFQRTMMYPLALIGLVAVVRRDRSLRPYFVALASVGLAFSLYHNTIELFPDVGDGACSVFGPPCNVVYFRALGIYSLATMALSAFLAIIVLNTVQFPDLDNDATTSPKSVGATETK